MPHPKDLGVAIRDALELIEHVELFDWSDEDSQPSGMVTIHDVDASHSFDSLVVRLGDGSKFRVSITNYPEK